MDKDLSTEEIETLRECARFCAAVESAGETSMENFVNVMVKSLPSLYLAFVSGSEETDIENMFPSSPAEYVDEEKYEAVRGRMAALFGEHDVYLETFEEDMKYSETPIAASISESLADIFQPVCNFLLTVRAGEGSGYGEAFAACRESFGEYWSQTLVNVMRPLNHLRYHNMD